MANPKYAGLPGIAPPDEKDVYETDDLPEADQDQDYLEEPESDDIERPHLNISNAHQKFKGKTLICGRDVDFSDRYRRKRHNGYQTVDGEWEIQAAGEPETILQRYHRIQCETKELIDDINKLKSSADDKNPEMANSAALILTLQQSLTQLDLNFSLVTSGDLADSQGFQFQKLLSKIEQVKSAQGRGPGSAPAPGGPALAMYQLENCPALSQFQETARVVDLEKRLNRLESVLGTEPDKLSRLRQSEFSSLWDAAVDLSARSSLLESSQLDKVESRLGMVLSKMDAIAERRGPEYQELLSKTNELYEKFQSVECLNRHLAPTIQRLRALHDLHNEAVNFQRSIVEIRTDQGEIARNIAMNEESLQKAKDDLKGQLEAVQKNTEALQKRLAALKK